MHYAIEAEGRVEAAKLLLNHGFDLHSISKFQPIWTVGQARYQRYLEGTHHDMNFCVFFPNSMNYNLFSPGSSEI